MDPRIFQATYRVQHAHGDGGWGEMVEQRSHHDPADHDQERSWQQGRVFRCATCDESVTIVADERGIARPER